MGISCFGTSFAILKASMNKQKQERYTMTMIKFDPVRTILGFNKFFEDSPLSDIVIDRTFNPAIDISGDEKELYVTVEIPGIRKEDIKVVVENNVLTVSGEKKTEKKTEENQCYRSERVYGSFSRSFKLPSEINTAEVEAKFENGLLNIRLPKYQSKTAAGRVINLQ